MYELMARGKELFLLHLPQGVDLPYARDMWRAEVRRLKEYLEERFGAEITDDALRAAARQRNALREARSHLMEVLRADPPISGTGLYKVLVGWGLITPLPLFMAEGSFAARLRNKALPPGRGAAASSPAADRRRRKVLSARRARAGTGSSAETARASNRRAGA